MAERFSNDPYQADASQDQLRQSRLDSELQVDPELAEGSASGGRVAVFAVAIALLLGGVFYGLNNTSVNPAGTGQNAQTSTANPANQTAQNSSAAPQPGIRDVTPRNNDNPGTTVGAAPAPATPKAAEQNAGGPQTNPPANDSTSTK